MKWIVVLVVILYLVIVLPVVGKLPMLDGNTEFYETYHIFTKGVAGYVQIWSSVHPPLKGLMMALGFMLGGVSTTSYTLAGVLYGVVGIVSYMYMVKRLSNVVISSTAGILLVLTGGYCALTPNGLRDVLVIMYISGALWSYVNKRWICMGMCLLAAWFTKETLLLLPGAIIAVECLVWLIQRKKLAHIPLWPLIVSIGVIALYGLWLWYLHQIGGVGWNATDAIFSPYASKGPLYIMVRNVLTFGFLNMYAYENWVHMLVFNFHWVYVSVCVLGVMFVVRRMQLRERGELFDLSNQIHKTYAVIVLFVLFYMVVVLGFQTFAIYRYVMPIVPFLYMATAAALWCMYTRIWLIGVSLHVLVYVVALVGLYASVDPVTVYIWKKYTVLDQPLYNAASMHGGNDSIAYNAQYLQIMSKRDSLIRTAQETGGPVVSGDCYYVFPDPRNEQKVFEILGFSESITQTKCVL